LSQGTWRRNEIEKTGRIAAAIATVLPGPARVVVENVNHPGKGRPVHATNDRAMRRTLLKVLPPRSPGFTQAEMLRAVLIYRPRSSQVVPKLPNPRVQRTRVARNRSPLTRHPSGGLGK
jgi:hypothetical protein